MGVLSFFSGTLVNSSRLSAGEIEGLQEIMCTVLELPTHKKN